MARCPLLLCLPPLCLLLSLLFLPPGTYTKCCVLVLSDTAEAPLPTAFYPTVLSWRVSVNIRRYEVQGEDTLGAVHLWYLLCYDVLRNIHIQSVDCERLDMFVS